MRRIHERVLLVGGTDSRRGRLATEIARVCGVPLVTADYVANAYDDGLVARVLYRPTPLTRWVCDVAAQPSKTARRLAEHCDTLIALPTLSMQTLPEPADRSDYWQHIKADRGVQLRQRNWETAVDAVADRSIDRFILEGAQRADWQSQLGEEFLYPQA